MRKGFILLAIAAALAALSLIPDLITMGLFLFILPGLILLASETALIYLLALVPAHFLYRLTGRRSGVVAAGLAWVLLVALAPGLIGRWEFDAFVQATLATDFAHPTAIQPRSYELPLEWGGTRAPNDIVRNYWPGSHEPRPACAELCQALLFNADAEAVFIAIGGNWVGFEPKRVREMIYWRFRLDRREECPDTVSKPRPQFLARIAGGECLIEERVEKADPDVVLKAHRSDSLIENRSESVFAPHSAYRPWLLNGDVTTIEVRERIGAALQTVERRTGYSALGAPMPFYIGLQNLNLSVYPQVATVPLASRSADANEILERRYGLRLKAAASPPKLTLGDVNRAVLMRILGRSYGPSEILSQADSGFVKNSLEQIGAQDTLSAEDVAVLRAAIRQNALTGYIAPGPIARHSDVAKSLHYPTWAPVGPSLGDRSHYKGNVERRSQ